MAPCGIPNSKIRTIEMITWVLTGINAKAGYKSSISRLIGIVIF